MQKYKDLEKVCFEAVKIKVYISVACMYDTYTDNS